MIQRVAIDVRENLNARRPELADGPIDLPDRRIGIVHRQRRDERREALGMLREHLERMRDGVPLVRLDEPEDDAPAVEESTR